MKSNNNSNFNKWVAHSTKQYESYGNKITLQERSIIQKRDSAYPTHTLCNYIDNQKKSE